ncbi:MAG: metal-activated pyridoxal enzyme [Actinomycetia bacterium]|nr:metal-activated pyridoxal enzyme [Actinomycetes bacterium]
MSDALNELSTPVLWADLDVLDRNLATMARRWPGTSLRPHVKAHKTTELARRQMAMGHIAFTCATPREVIGMAAAGLGDDLLLANQTVDHTRLRAMADADARVTVAVDSAATVDAAAEGGIGEVLIDIRVGFRCGCTVDEAGPLADRARARGMTVRGVMGYEGHAMGVTDEVERTRVTEEAMNTLAAAHDAVGGDVVSGGGTGTWTVNSFVNELQAGSYVLMDTTYAEQRLPFEQGLFVEATIVSVAQRYVVCDAGLKALGMDHGLPQVLQAEDIVYCSDEHTVFTPAAPMNVGDRVRLVPAHIDPTMAKHRELVIVEGGSVVDHWSIDLRHW